MIRLLDVLGIPATDFSNYKVHFAMDDEDKMKPFKKYLLGEFKGWQEHQTNKNFSRKYILSLIYYGKDRWLFGGIYEVLSKNPVAVSIGDWSGWKYETKLVDNQIDLIGRLVVYYKKDYRMSYPNLELEPSNKESMKPRDVYIISMSEQKASINDFSGFDNVNVDYEMLKMIVSEDIVSWKSALSNVKGIYLIADKKTGQQYVGSASGDDCIWQRWATYAKDGHGDNVELKALLKKNGQDYKYNFKYSILEVCNMNLGTDYILGRENYWKSVLQTREFGLNKN